MGDVSWVVEDASSAGEALGLFVATFVSFGFEYELRDEYEVDGEIRCLYAVILLDKWPLNK
jgi:hypothetical protein